MIFLTVSTIIYKFIFI